jgi:hypothetical protein
MRWYAIVNSRITQPAVIAFITGLFSAAAQVIYLRELFSIFTGNEFIFSCCICCWMAFTAVGCRGALFKKCTYASLHLILLLHLLLFCTGVFLIRAFPLVMTPGEQFPPFFTALIIFITISPVSFLSGLLFRLCTYSVDGINVYRWDNMGNLAGFILITICILFAVPHRIAIGAITILYLPLLINRWWYFGLAGGMLVFIFLLDPVSARWKYHCTISSIEYGRSGEIGKSTDGSVWLNNTIYKANITNAHIEQAVHAPLSIRYPGSVLLIHDNGHLNEIRKYSKTLVHCIELEPLLADSECSCNSPERLPENIRYDAIILGCGIPQNIAEGRMFTDHFFKLMKSKLNKKGVFSFSFNINTAYVDKNTRQIIEITKVSLKSCFKYVKLFPGEGITFLSSDHLFSLPDTSYVPTAYYNDYILPGVSSEMVESFNRDSIKSIVNTVGHPVLLKNSINRYFQMFKIPARFVYLLVIVVMLMLLWLFWQSKGTVSIGTTGFCCGLYSIILMMLYQSQFGTLYSAVSMFMISMSIGFILGSFIKSDKFNDISVLVYTFLTLLLFRYFPGLPEFTWYFFNMLMGVIVAAQLVNIKENVARMNAADIAGGVAGIFLGGVFILPFSGIGGALVMVLVVKMGPLLFRGGFGKTVS